MLAVDAVFVVNQSVDIDDLRRACAKARFRRVAVLSTQHLFEWERAVVERVAEEVRIHSFAELLSDDVMEACDRRATADLAGSLAVRGGRRSYGRRFVSLSLMYKNEAVFNALREMYVWRKTYYVRGLGVSGEFWRRQRGVRLRARSGARRKLTLPPKVMPFVDFVDFLGRVKRIYVLRAPEGEYCFTSIRRLGFTPGTRFEQRPLSVKEKVLAALREGSLRPTKILRRIAGEDAILATTIHDYPACFADDPEPLQIFVDGFHPSNYPRTYLDQYGEAVFVAVDPFSVEWFKRFGRHVRPVPTFLAASTMTPPSVSRVDTVVLALNHAGDWTALINRSDTDVLVEQFCEVARMFPDIRFVVRPHPTMTHPAHEGPESRNRIECHVNSVGLANLEVSRGTLSDDLARGDVFVSEYSQVLIDAIKLGKIGIITNFTGRRSFMVDYERCGFLSAHNRAQLCDLLRTARTEPEVLREQQAAAARWYDDLLVEFLSEGAGKSLARKALSLS